MRAMQLAILLAVSGCSEILGIEDVLPPGGDGSCFTAMEWSSPMPRSQLAERTAAGDQIDYSARLNDDSVPDAITIQLLDGFGVYADPARPIEPIANLPLSGAESDLATCGACVLLVADLNAVSRDFRAMYMPMGGTITVTAIAPRLVGRLEDVTFVEVELGEAGTRPKPNGCTSHMTSFGFDVAVTQAP